MTEWEQENREEELQPPQPSPPEESLGWLDILYGTLFQPQATFSRLLERPPYLLSLIVFAVVGLVSAAIARQMGPALLTELKSIPGFEPGLGFDLARISSVLSVMAFWIGLVNWFLMTGVFHLVAVLLGGRGSAAALFPLIGLANLPAIFAAPLAAIELNTGVSTLSSLGLALDIWRYYLYYRAIRVVYSLSRGRSLVVLLSPLVVFIVAVTGFALLALLMVSGLGPGA